MIRCVWDFNVAIWVNKKQTKPKAVMYTFTTRVEKLLTQQMHCFAVIRVYFLRSHHR